MKPGENGSGESKVGGEAVEEDGVGNGIEGCREIEEDQETDVAGVGCHEEIVGNFDQGGLCTVVCSVAGLEGVEEFVVGHVVMKLYGNNSFQGFTEEGKVGDGAVVVEFIGVQARLL